TWASGNTADISSRTVTIGSSGATLNTNGNNVTLANSIGNNGSGALTKIGNGTLTLGAAAGWTGPNNLNGGGGAGSNVNQLSSNTIVFNGAGLTLTGTLNFPNTISFASDATFGGTATVTLSGVFTNSGGAGRKLTNNVTGTVTLSNNVYISNSAGSG